LARKQKLGLSTSRTRTLLLDAAEELMREEGYAAVTSRRLGDKAGVKPQLVHYYFASMDDLFVTLYRRRAERSLKVMSEALEGDDVLHTLWKQSSDPSHVALSLEFMALANHRKVVRAETVKYAEQLRHIQHRALLRYLKSHGLEAPIAPNAIIVLLASVGLLLVLESEAGMQFGHAEMQALVKASLAELAGSRKGSARSARKLPLALKL
jgi:AcrR family transcriptional regulator